MKIKFFFGSLFILAMAACGLKGPINNQNEISGTPSTIISDALAAEAYEGNHAEIISTAPNSESEDISQNIEPDPTTATNIETNLVNEIDQNNDSSSGNILASREIQVGNDHFWVTLSIEIDIYDVNTSNSFLNFYQGNNESNDFLHSISIAGQLSEEYLDNLILVPDSLPNSSIENNIIKLYQIAGFEYRASREYSDGAGNRYLAVIMHLGPIYKGLTFEDINGQLQFIYAFDLPELPPIGSPIDFWEAGPEMTFDELWISSSSEVIPVSSFEKGLLALGCEQYGNNLSQQAIPYIMEDQIQELVLFSCTLFSDPQGFNPLTNNYVVVFLSGEEQNNPVFAKWYSVSTSSEWIDIEPDEKPELSISKYTFYNQLLPAGDELYQIYGSFKFRNLLEIYGRAENPEEKILGTGSFEDLDDDGKLEYIIRYGHPYGLGAYRAAAKSFNSIRAIYTFRENAFVSVDTDFPEVCENALSALNDRGIVPGETDGMFIVYESFSALLTCGTVEQADLGYQTFIEFTDPQLYSSGCNPWLSEVRNLVSTIYNSQSSFWSEESLSLYSTGIQIEVFSQAETNCFILEKPNYNIENGATSILPSEDVQATFMYNQITIDGDFEDWQLSSFVESPYRVYESQSWDGTDDLTAKWQLGWNNQYLYVQVHVEHDIHAQSNVGNKIWQGDSIEIQIDTNLYGDQNIENINSDDYQILISPGDFSTIPLSVYVSQGTIDGRFVEASSYDIQAVSIRNDSGYSIEVAISWEMFENLTVRENLLMGLNLNVSENDSINVPNQEALYSNVESRSLTNPTTWGTLMLLDGT